MSVARRLRLLGAMLMLR